MPINFEEIPSDIEISSEEPKKIRTVLEEIIARQSLLKERTIKCKDIGPLYEKHKKKPLRYTYKYFCICPKYNSQYKCQHNDNIIIDRDALTKDEHVAYLATPKADIGAPRKMPYYVLKKSIMPKCTARINRLAAPDLKQVNDTLNNFEHVISKRHKRSLYKHLEKRPAIEYTSIQTALEWLAEEKRLKKVAKKLEKLRCKRISRKIEQKQRSHIKKIICVLFEQMKEFLLNDQFVMDENSALVAVILEALKGFTDKEFHTTTNLRAYQQVLAFNLAAWINKFISNLNIHVAEAPTNDSPQTQEKRLRQDEMTTFIPVQDYISDSSLSDEAYYEDEQEEYYSSYHDHENEDENERIQGGAISNT